MEMTADKPLQWQKYVQLTKTLRVSIDSSVEAGKTPKFIEGIEIPPDEFLEKKEIKMIHRAQMKVGELGSKIFEKIGLPTKENLDRYSHPVIGFADGKVSFKIHIVKENPEDKLPYLRITLWKRGAEKYTHSILKCGRAVELSREHQDRFFGFDSKRCYSEKEIERAKYLPLSYPGKNGIFEPVFVKVMEHENRPAYYLKITAHDETDNIVVVEASEVDVKEVPEFLKKA